MENTINKSNDELTRKDAHEILTDSYDWFYGTFMFYAGVTFMLALHFFTIEKTAAMVAFLMMGFGSLYGAIHFRKKLKARVMEMIKEIP